MRFNIFMPLMAALCMLTSAIPAAADGVVYFDNTATQWESPHLHYWNDDTGLTTTWPGVVMEETEYAELWSYTVPDGVAGVIFNAGGDGATQTSDLVYADNHVYTYADGDSGMTLEAYLEARHQAEGDDKEYTIHFHNTEGWNNINVHISGVTPAIDGEMASFLNSVIFDYTFTAPEHAVLHCRFYEVAGDAERETTATFELVDGHVYTISGDKGPRDQYDPNKALPEKEYWLEPEMPSARDAAKLYFRRDFDPEGNLRNEDEIYIYPGLIRAGAADSDWTVPPGFNWNSLTDKHRMTQDADNPDLFYVNLEPSIAGYLDVDPEMSYAKMAVIFRNFAGSIKQHVTDQFIPLRVVAPVAETLGATTGYELQSDGAVRISAENGSLYITPWSREIVKVFTLRNTATVTEERRSISVVENDDETAAFDVAETDEAYVLSISGGVTVKVDKATSLLSFFNAGTDLSTPALKEAGGLTNRPGNVSVTFDAMHDGGFYGGGYQGNLINWDGRMMVMNNNQQGGWGQGGSLSRNICIPFYVSTEGYGVYFDDHYRGATITPSADGTVYSSRSQNPIAYYYVGGGSMEKVVSNYTVLTGRQELPPYWALGYITSKFSFATRAEAEATVENTRQARVPLDGIVFDIHWQSGSFGSGTARMGRIDWERSAYPDPEEMMKNFRDQNVHTIAITEPYFTTNSYNYEVLEENGWLADGDVSGMQWLNSEKVGLLDVTNPGAVEWFKDLYKKRTLEGIESWWLDLGEPERHDDDSRYQDGTVAQVHNEYGVLWNALAYDAMKEATPDARFITMPRAGTSGMQRYNAFPWTGDIARSWAGLRAQVPSLVSAAMSGVSYLGSDIGGFTAYGTDADLYRRWVQLGVFYPSMRTHSATEPEVWRPAYADVLDDVRDAINLRYAYLPYTYTQSYAYTRYGTPIARPANYADADKSVLRNEIGAYFWGPDVFVAPVLDNGTSKSITFPDGDWLDMTDFSTVYRGHQAVNYNAPASVLPRFMRRGSFVPRFMQDEFTSTAEIENDKIIVDYFATTDATTEGSIFYDDDHMTVDPISSGEYLLTRFSATAASDDRLSISISHEGDGWAGMPESRHMILRIHDFRVTNDGAPLDEDMLVMNVAGGPTSAPSRAPQAATTPFKAVSSAEEVHAATDHAFYHDTAAGKLYLAIPAMSTAQNLSLDLGSDGGVTGLNVTATSAMTLGYGNGIITYCAAPGVTDLHIDLFTATGSAVATYAGLTADGYASQLTVDLPAGFYIARLSGRDASGRSVSKTLKMVCN